MEHGPVLTLLVPMTTALVIPLVSFRAARALTLAALSGALVVAGRTLAASLATGPIHYQLAGWVPPWGIELVVDPLSGVMALLVVGMALAAAFYSGPFVTGWSTRRRGTFYSVYCLLVTGLLGIVLTGDLFNLYVFLEISSLPPTRCCPPGGASRSSRCFATCSSEPSRRASTYSASAISTR